MRCPGGDRPNLRLPNPRANPTTSVKPRDKAQERNLTQFLALGRSLLGSLL